MNNQIEALVLAGGLGTRLRPAIGSSTPKALAPIGKEPFLNLLFDNLIRANIERATISIGHLGSAIRDKYNQGYKSLQIQFVEEATPLGTGGAVQNALLSMRCQFVLILNGDTLIEYPVKEMIDKLETGVDAVALVTRVENSDRFGSIEISETGFVTGLLETESHKPTHVYAGVTLAKPRALSSLSLPPFPFGFEEEILRKLSNRRQLKAILTPKGFLDIGTPQSFIQAQENAREE